MTASDITITVTTVEDRARFVRRGEPVAIGVPFPRGSVTSGESWSLVDALGQSSPTQATILDRWGDGSVRWLLLEFQATVAADGASSYSLVDRPPPITDPLRVTPLAAGLSVDTGVAQFTVPQSGAIAISQARIANATFLSDLTVIAEDADGRAYRFSIRHSSITRAGDLTAVLRLDGDLVAEDGTPWLDTSVTLQFYAGHGAVRVEVSCTNRRAAVHPEGIWDLGDPGSVLIRDLSVTMRPGRAMGAVAASVDREHAMSVAGSRFEIYQDSSGGEEWHSRNHLNRHNQVPTTFRGFKAVADGRTMSGLRGSPIASLGAGDSRVSIAMPYFWETFPKALTITKECCVVGILPRQFSDSHELQGGERTTFGFTLAVGEDTVSAEPLAWVRSPLLATVNPDVFRRAGLWTPLAVGSPEAQANYENLVEGVIGGDAPFSRRREIIDEYGWRHFGEVYADHEAVNHPGLISHYNNQYDAIAGMAARFMQTGDPRWWSAVHELASHVTDIDLYHSQRDRAAYNGGYFWHTQHYAAAGTATHRSYSRLAVTSGGGPSAEHNYTSGLMLHYFLTGCSRSREAVQQLADWVVDMDNGRKSRFRWIDRHDTGLASSTRSPDFHGPGRGAGNSINALLDAHRLSGESRYLRKAESLIARCSHPDDDQHALQLLDAENRWSYTVFLQTLGKYLDYRADRGLVDEHYAYAREVLLKYSHWMLQHERPYLERPEQLEFPTETWAAQDLRKAAVFEFAARHSVDSEDRVKFLMRAEYFFDYSITALRQAATGRLVRPLVLLLAYGFQRPFTPQSGLAYSAPTHRSNPRVKFIPQRQHVVRRLRLVALGVVAAALAILVATLSR